MFYLKKYQKIYRIVDNVVIKYCQLNAIDYPYDELYIASKPQYSMVTRQ